MSRQRGATAVEFALVFPVLFAITFASITYGFAFYLQQSINYIAEEAARAAVAVDPTAPGSNTDNIKAAVNSSITASKAKLVVAAVVGAGYTVDPTTVNGHPAVRVTVTVPTAALNIATFVIPYVGAFPPLPAAFTASAVAQTN